MKYNPRPPLLTKYIPRRRTDMYFGLDEMTNIIFRTDARIVTRVYMALTRCILGVRPTISRICSSGIPRQKRLIAIAIAITTGIVGSDSMHVRGRTRTPTVLGLMTHQTCLMGYSNSLAQQIRWVILIKGISIVYACK